MECLVIIRGSVGGAYSDLKQGPIPEYVIWLFRTCYGYVTSDRITDEPKRHRHQVVWLRIARHETNLTL